jgi:hypothetical protein
MPPPAGHAILVEKTVHSEEVTRMAFKWERIESDFPDKDGNGKYPTPIFRAKVPRGWFVLIEGQQPFFFPDEEHTWSGDTMAPGDDVVP